MSRVQVEEIAPVRPQQATQVVGDTYAGAPKPVEDRNMERLASALGGFSDTLATAASRAQRTPQADPREAQVRWYLSSASDDQLRNDVMGGKVQHWDVPKYRELYTTNLAQREARKLFADISQRVASGEIPAIGPNGEHIDIWPVIQQRVGQAYQGAGPLARDPAYAKVFQETFEGKRKDLDDQATKIRGNWQHQAFRGITESALDSVIAHGSDAKNDDASLAKRWFDIKNSLGGRFGDSRRPEMDDIMVGRLKALADKDPETAARILSLDRGNGVGSMIKDPRMREQINPLLEQIRVARRDRFDRTTKEEAANEALKRFDAGDQSFNVIEDRRYANPFDPANPTRTISANEAKELALLKARERNEASLARQGAAPEVVAKEVFEADAERYIGSNVPNRAWSQTITDVGRVLGNPAAATEPQNVQKLVAAKTLYEDLSAKNPGYVKETLKVGDREEKLFQMARMYEETAGLPPEVAMQRATTTMLNSTPEFDRAARDRVKTITNNPEGVWLNFMRGSTINNRMAVQKQVEDLASAIAQDTSITPEKAVTAAGKIISERIVTVNGQAVIGSPHVTKANEAAWQFRLRELVATNPSIQGMDGTVSDASKLSIRPMVQDPSKFHVVDSQGLPVTSVFMDADGKTIRRVPLTIRATEIRQIEAQLRQQREETVQRQVEINSIREEAKDTRPNTPERRAAMEAERAAVNRRNEIDKNRPVVTTEERGVTITETAPQTDRRNIRLRIREGMLRQGYGSKADQRQAITDFNTRNGDN
jgi:hypothetical protein